MAMLNSWISYRVHAARCMLGAALVAGLPVAAGAAEWPPDFNVSLLDGSNGFQINGEAEADRSGRWVAAAGDVNGDGFGDVIVGAHYADINGDGFRRQLCGVRQGLGVCPGDRVIGA